MKHVSAHSLLPKCRMRSKFPDSEVRIQHSSSRTHIRRVPLTSVDESTSNQYWDLITGFLGGINFTLSDAFFLNDLSSKNIRVEVFIIIQVQNKFTGTVMLRGFSAKIDYFLSSSDEVLCFLSPV